MHELTSFLIDRKPKSVANKTRSWRLYKAFPTTSFYEKLKKASKKCSCAVKKYQLSIEEKLVKNGNMGSFYKYINNKLNGPNGTYTAPLRDVNGSVHTANGEKADLLNKHFSSLFTTDNDLIDSSRLPKQIPHTLSHVCFTPELVLKHIQQLKSKSSGGPDGLPAFFSNPLEAASLSLYQSFSMFHCKLVIYQIYGNLPLLYLCLRKDHPAIHVIIDLFLLPALRVS